MLWSRRLAAGAVGGLVLGAVLRTLPAAAGATTSAAAARSSLASLENVWNCRDVAWLVPGVRPLRLVRCGNPARATMDDSLVLRRVFPRVRTLVDLRSHEELEMDVDAARHFHERKTVHHRPLGDRSTIGAQLVRRANVTSLLRYAYRRLVLGDVEGAKGEMIPYMRGLLGLNEMMLEHEGFALGHALRLLVTSQAPVLIYCTAGKDRTGLVTALALSAAGQPREDILRDYEASNQASDVIFARAMQSVMPNGVSHQEARSWAEAPREVMERTFAFIEERWGGVPQYLDEIGFSESWRARLRARLTDHGERGPWDYAAMLG